jgi:hypothetical protein
MRESNVVKVTGSRKVFPGACALAKVKEQRPNTLQLIQTINGMSSSMFMVNNPFSS